MKTPNGKHTMHSKLTAPEHAPILERLRAAGVPVEASGHRLAAYSYDASNYRIPPIGVCFRAASRTSSLPSRRAGKPILP